MKMSRRGTWFRRGMTSLIDSYDSDRDASPSVEIRPKESDMHCALSCMGNEVCTKRQISNNDLLGLSKHDDHELFMIPPLTSMILR